MRDFRLGAILLTYGGVIINNMFFFFSGVHKYDIREKVGGGRLSGHPPGPDHQKRGSLASSGLSISQDREQLKRTSIL